MAGKLGKVQKEMLSALTKEIASGHFNIGDSLGNPRSLAQRYNVSRTTAYNVIRWLEEQELVEVQPQAGIVLKKKSPEMFDHGHEKSHLMFIRISNDSLSVETYEGLVNAPLANSFKITMTDASSGVQAYKDILDHVPANVKIIVLFPLDEPEIIDGINRLIARGVQIIQIDRINEAVSSPGITFDNFSGGLQATLHLIREHDLPVYYLGDACKPESMRKRYQGWATAMRESGYLELEKYRISGFDDDIPCELGPVHDLYRTELERFLTERKRKKTAIFASNDYIALAGHQIAAKLDITVGKDLFLVGFDDLELCRRQKPRLSSVRASHRELGEEVIEMAVGLNSDNGIWNKVLPVELKIRESSRPVAKTAARQSGTAVLVG